MINTSTEYKTCIASNSRHFEVKVVVGSTTYTKVRGFKYKSGTNSSDEISFGDTVSSVISFTLSKLPKGTILRGKTAKPYIGLQLSNGIEWIPLGVFHLEKPVRNGNDIKVTAYDNFTLCEKGFFSSLKGNQKVANILKEQCEKIGIAYAGGADDVSYNVDNLQGMTIREAVGILSAYCGKNAIMDRNGNLKLVWYQDNNLDIYKNRYAEPLEISEEDTYINCLNCSAGNESALTVGQGIGINFACLGMTQERLQVLYDGIKGFTYRALKLTWKLAQPEVEAGDLVDVVGSDGSVYRVPLMEFELNCDGGCYGTITSKGKTQEEQEHEYKGPMQKKVERAYTEVISTKQLLADTIDAFTGNFEIINTNYLNVSGKLTAVEGEFESLKASNAEFTTTVTNKLLAYDADIVSLKASYAKIGTLEVSVAQINSLLSGTVTAGSTQTIVLNAQNTTIANALIKSAMIDSLSADKVTAGTIDTSSIHIKSKTGNMDLYDNTLSIRDASRVRVQIGKDASNDYNIYIWDATGKLMFDGKGLKADGIKDKIIRNDMVSDTANIDGKKINIASVVTQINAGTTKIESSHVVYDGKSLDVAFNTMVTDVNGKITTLSTTLKAEQGKIATLITDTTQIKGNISTLQTNYSTLNQTVSGLSTTVGSHTSTLTTLSNEIGNLSVGGRNLLKNAKSINLSGSDYASNTKRELGKVTTLVAASRCNFYLFVQSILSESISDLISTIGVQYVLSLEIRTTGMDNTATIDFGWDFRGGSAGTDRSVNAIARKNDCEGKWYRMKNILVTISKTDHKSVLICGGINNFPKGVILEYRNLKLERGNRSTDFAVAPEDIDGTIKTVSDKQSALELTVNQFKTTVSSTYATKAQLTTVDGKFASYSTTTAMNSAITAKANEITSAVSKTYATQAQLTTANGNISALTTRVTTAESKITDSAIVSTVTKSSTWTTLNTKVNSTADLLIVKDTREVNSNPQWYFTNYPKKSVKEFKKCTVIGLSGEGTYCELVTETPWSDSSGGYPTQLAYPNNSQNIYRRVGTSNTAWGAWTKVAGSHNIISSINQTAESIKISAGKIDLNGFVTVTNLKNDGATTISGGKLTCTNFEATNGKFTGEINAKSGTFGNWTINKTTGSISSKSNNNYSGMIVIQNTQPTPVEGGSVAGVVIDATSFKMITATADSGIDVHAVKAGMGGGDIMVKAYQGGSYAMLMSAEVYGGTGFKTTGFVQANGEIRGGSLYSSGTLYVAGKITCNTISTDQVSISGNLTASTINTSGSLSVRALFTPYIELSMGTPYIDFHYGSSTIDYTSRIIEDQQYRLKMQFYDGHYMQYYSTATMDGCVNLRTSTNRFAIMFADNTNFEVYSTRGSDNCTNIKSISAYTWFSNTVSVAGLINRSKEEYKCNINEATNTVSALELVRSSKVYEYALKEEAGKGIIQRHYGFIVERETPVEIISGDGVDTYAIASLGWQAIKELAENIDEMRNDISVEISKLKGQMHALESQL